MEGTHFIKANTILYIALSIVLLLNLRFSFAALPSQLAIATGEWPPWISQNFKQYGIIADITTKAFKAQNINVIFTFLPWKIAFLNTLGNHYDASVAWAKTEKREQEFYYSKNPIITSKEVLFFHLDSYTDWKTYEDLKNLKLGVTVGYSYGPEFFKAANEKIFKVIPQKSDLTNLNALIHKQIDAFVCNLDACTYLLRYKFNNELNKQVIPSEHPIVTQNLYLIVAKNQPNAKEIIEAFDNGFATLRSNGDLLQMLLDNTQGKYQ